MWRMGSIMISCHGASLAPLLMILNVQDEGTEGLLQLGHNLFKGFQTSPQDTCRHGTDTSRGGNTVQTYNGNRRS